MDKKTTEHSQQNFAELFLINKVTTGALMCAAVDFSLAFIAVKIASSEFVNERNSIILNSLAAKYFVCMAAIFVAALASKIVDENKSCVLSICAEFLFYSNSIQISTYLVSLWIFSPEGTEFCHELNGQAFFVGSLSFFLLGLLSSIGKFIIFSKKGFLYFTGLFSVSILILTDFSASFGWIVFSNFPAISAFLVVMCGGVRMLEKAGIKSEEFPTKLTLR